MGDGIAHGLTALLLNPREDLAVEHKGWLDLRNNRAHRANLAKALLALANYGGGHVVLGFREGKDGGLEPAPDRPTSLAQYGQDEINKIVRRFAEPQFHCQVDFVAHPSDGAKFPIIRVPGGHTVPIQARRGGPHDRHLEAGHYYIRRPGPESSMPRGAREWDQLIRRCIRNSRAEMLQSIEAILTGGNDESRPERDRQRERLHTWIARCETRIAERNDGPTDYPWPFGRFRAVYTIEDVRGDTHSGELLEALASAHHWTLTPPWRVLDDADQKPYPDQGDIECWLPRSPERPVAELWRASSAGLFYTQRGYEEDYSPAPNPAGSVLSNALPVWRMGEVMYHAQQMAQVLGHDESSIHLEVRWSGLQGRHLSTWPDRGYRELRRYCRQDELTSNLSFRADRVGSQLPELLARLLRPLFDAFDFFALPREFYELHVRKLQSRDPSA